MNPNNMGIAPPTQLEQIASGLQAFGAGIGGQLPQFQQTQLAKKQQQQQQLQFRQAAAWQDIAASKYHLDNNDVDSFLGLAINRLENLRDYPDADPSDTQRLAKLAIMARNGDEGALNALKGEINALHGQGQAIGAIAKPESDNVVINGQLVNRDTVEVVGDFRDKDEEKDVYHTNLAKIIADRDGGKITPEQAEKLIAKELGPTAASAREQKIQDYMRIAGVSRDEAIRLIDSEIILDDAGNLSILDPISQTAKAVEIQRQDTRNPQADFEPVDVADLSYEAGTGTGVGAALIGMYNSTIGQVPFLPIAGKDVEATAQKLRILQRSAVDALRSSARPPVIEQKAIMASLPQPMDPLENPEIANQKMTYFVDLMLRQYSADLSYYNDKNNDKKSRNDVRNRARSIEKVLRETLEPDAYRDIMGTVENMYNPKDFSSMSLEEKLEIDLTTLSDEELEKL
jgi:hypothetical protein